MTTSGGEREWKRQKESEGGLRERKREREIQVEKDRYREIQVIVERLNEGWLASAFHQSVAGYISVTK